MMSFPFFDEIRLLGSPVPAGRSEPEACAFFQRQRGALSLENVRRGGCPYPFIIAFTPPNTQNP